MVIFYTFHQFHCRVGLWNFLGCHIGNLSPAMIFNLMLVFLLVCYSTILLFESGNLNTNWIFGESKKFLTLLGVIILHLIF